MEQNWKPVPENWKKVLDSNLISKTITRIAYEILEKNKEPQKILGKLSLKIKFHQI